MEASNHLKIFQFHFLNKFSKQTRQLRWINLGISTWEIQTILIQNIKLLSLLPRNTKLLCLRESLEIILEIRVYFSILQGWTKVDSWVLIKRKDSAILLQPTTTSLHWQNLKVNLKKLSIKNPPFSGNLRRTTLQSK